MTWWVAYEGTAGVCVDFVYVCSGTSRLYMEVDRSYCSRSSKSSLVDGFTEVV